MSLFNSLIDEVSALLKLHKWQLITAESCTGGLLSALLTEIPGSSAWFERGFVTYSNLAKEEMLGVSKRLLEEYGAVSTQVAAAMASGALHHSAGNIAVSITGVAGPDGASVEKPLGTVCFAWITQEDSVVSLRQQFSGTRQEIRLAACEEALNGILRILKSRQ